MKKSDAADAQAGKKERAKGEKLLNHSDVKGRLAPGKYADGGNLFLEVAGGGAKGWLFRYTSPTERDGKGNPRRRDMGLGTFDVLSLAEAREARDEARKLIARGIDPIEYRNAQRAEATKDTVPFWEDHAALVIKRMQSKAQSVEDTYLRLVGAAWAPGLQGQRVNDISTAMVVETLELHWTRAPTTAKRLRWLIETILDSARVTYPGHFQAAWARDGGNPARWKGHLKILLGKQKHKPKNYASLPHEEIGDYVARLQAAEEIGARALEFLLLTAARPCEVRRAVWANIDFDAKVWIVPDEDHKKDRDHYVPLSDRAIAVLKRLIPPEETPDPDALVFPSPFRGGTRQLSPSTLRKAALRFRPDIHLTPHGFRSTFRTWGAAQRLNRDMLERCLSHLVGDETERAYDRYDYLDDRREIMDAWAERCGNVKGDKIVPFKKKAA